MSKISFVEVIEMAKQKGFTPPLTIKTDSSGGIYVKQEGQEEYTLLNDERGDDSVTIRITDNNPVTPMSDTMERIFSPEPLPPVSKLPDGCRDTPPQVDTDC